MLERMVPIYCVRARVKLLPKKHLISTLPKGKPMIVVVLSKGMLSLFLVPWH